jgi:thioredoxin-related protein
MKSKRQNITVLYILIFVFFIVNLKPKDSAPNDSKRSVTLSARNFFMVESQVRCLFCVFSAAAPETHLV